MTPAAVAVLAFDIFGTVVDWHGGNLRAAHQGLPGVEPATLPRRGKGFRGLAAQLSC